MKPGLKPNGAEKFSGTRIFRSWGIISMRLSHCMFEFRLMTCLNLSQWSDCYKSNECSAADFASGCFSASVTAALGPVSKRGITVISSEKRFPSLLITVSCSEFRGSANLLGRFHFSRTWRT